MSDELPLSTSNVKQEVKIRMGKDGQAAIPARTVMQNFDEVVKNHGDKPALHQKVMKPVSGTITRMLVVVSHISLNVYSLTLYPSILILGRESSRRQVDDLDLEGIS
jgi:hypothetical protein